MLEGGGRCLDPKYYREELEIYETPPISGKVYEVTHNKTERLQPNNPPPPPKKYIIMKKNTIQKNKKT